MTSLLLKSSLYKTNKVVIFLMQTNNPFCHWPITHTHTLLIDPTFCLQFIYGLASHVQVWRIMEDFCWWSSMLHNFHPLIWFVENPLSSINLIAENPLSSINLIAENPLSSINLIAENPLSSINLIVENPLSSINLICGKPKVCTYMYDCQPKLWRTGWQKQEGWMYRGIIWSSQPASQPANLRASCLPMKKNSICFSVPEQQANM